MASRNSKSSREARDARLQEAVAVVLAREERRQHPQGTWREGLWWPDPEERRDCCEAIRPTPANKQALESHCRSQAHIALLFGVSRPALRRAALEARRERWGAARRANDEPSTMESPSASEIEALLASTQAALRDAKTRLRLELNTLAPLLAGEAAAKAEALAELLKVMANVEKRFELLRRLAEMCREAEGAEQAYRQLHQPKPSSRSSSAAWAGLDGAPGSP